jgi:hypothetical protein
LLLALASRVVLSGPVGIHDHTHVFIVLAYQTSQYVVPRGGIFLGKWRSSFAESSDGKMNVLSA